MNSALEILGVLLAAAGAALAWGWPAVMVVVGVWIVASVMTR
jgi:hypothetical protein